MPYVYGAPEEPEKPPSNAELHRKLIEMQRELAKLKAERTQWRTAMKASVAAEVETTFANHTVDKSLDASEPPSHSTSGGLCGKSNAASDAGDNAALQQLETRLATRISGIADRLRRVTGDGGSTPPRSASMRDALFSASHSGAAAGLPRPAVPPTLPVPKQPKESSGWGDWSGDGEDTTRKQSATHQLLRRQTASPPSALRSRPSLHAAATAMTVASQLRSSQHIAPSPQAERDSPKEDSGRRRSSANLDKLRRDLAVATTSRKDASRGLSERHPLMAFLDVVFVILSVLACVAAIAITHAEGQREEFATGSDGFYATVAFLLVVEVSTFGWMASRFFLAKRKGDWEIVDDFPGIRRRYLRTWFAYDLVTALPLELAFFGWNWDWVRWVALRHFIRVPRIISLGNSFNPLLTSRLWFRFLSVCLLMLLGVGILAAIFWAVEPRYTFEESLYWAIATVTSVGYGDVVPDDRNSRIFVCFAMFAGIVAISVITAFATSFLTESDKLAAEAESRKQTMYAMLEHYNIPWEVQKEVIAAMPTMLDSFNRTSFAEMTAHLPTFVGQKVTDYVQAKALIEQPLFKRIADSEPGHVLVLARYVEQTVHPAADVLAEEGSPADALFVLAHGQVRLLMISFDDPDDEDGDGDCEAQLVDMGTLRPGETFGELDVENPEATRMMTAVAETVCTVLKLSRAAINELQESHRETYTALVAALENHATTDEPTFTNFQKL